MVGGHKDTCSLCGWNELIARIEELKYLPPRFGLKEVKVCVNCDALRIGNGFQNREYLRRYAEAARGTIQTSGQPSDLRLTDTGAAVVNFDKDSHPTPETVHEIRAAKALSADPSLMRQIALSRLKGFL